VRFSVRLLRANFHDGTRANLPPIGKGELAAIAPAGNSRNSYRSSYRSAISYNCATATTSDKTTTTAAKRSAADPC